MSFQSSVNKLIANKFQLKINKIKSQIRVLVLKVIHVRYRGNMNICSPVIPQLVSKPLGIHKLVE